jgi:hypothetical protein
MTQSKDNCDQTSIPAQIDAQRAISLAIYDSFEDLASLKDRWNSFVVECNSDIYMTFEWCLTWWKHYGRNRKLQIIVASANGEIIAIIPAFVESVRLGPVKLKIAKLVGADFTIQMCNPPIRREWAQAVITEMLRHFITDLKIEVILLAPFAGDYEPANTISNCVAGLDNLLTLAGVDASECHTVFKLPESFSQYLSDIGRRQRGNYTRDVNFISRSYEVASDVVADSGSMLSEFERFRVLHDGQWNAQKRLGHFRDWPSGYEYNRDLVLANAPLNRVRFYRFFLNGELAASQFCFVFGGCNYWRLPGRLHGEQYDKFGLGRVAMIRMFEESIKEGIQSVEAGRGHYHYKVQSGGVEFPVRAFRIVQNNALTLARVRAFTAMARALDMAYYKAVFVRASRYLPPLRRPIWKSWIKSRI